MGGAPPRIDGDERRPLAHHADGGNVHGARSGERAPGRRDEGRPPRLGVLLGRAGRCVDRDRIGRVLGRERASVRPDEPDLDLGGAQIDREDRLSGSHRYSTLPGLSSPCGSRAVLIDCMTRRTSGPTCSTSEARRLEPTPCSAVIVPPSSIAAR